MLVSRKLSTIDGSAPPNSPVSRFLSSYLIKLGEYPLLTKGITAGMISLSADAICQYWEQMDVEDKDKQVDWVRMARFSFLGSFLVSPTLHFWYGFLAKRLPGSTLTAAIQRLACDQLIFAPAFIPVFFSANLLLEGKADQIPRKIENDLLTTVISNYALWVPAQFINFRFIPPHLQVLFSNCVGFFWNVYFSYASNKDPAELTPESVATTSTNPTTATSAASVTTAAVVSVADDDVAAGVSNKVETVEDVDTDLNIDIAATVVIPDGVVKPVVATREKEFFVVEKENNAVVADISRVENGVAEFEKMMEEEVTTVMVASEISEKQSDANKETAIN